MKHDIRNIVRYFNIAGQFFGAEPINSGHINDTYLARFMGNDREYRYILQRINHRVFQEPEKVMKNIEGITRHLKLKIRLAGGDADRETLNFIQTHEGKSFCLTENGEYWRAYSFIENARTFDAVENPMHFYSAGKALGRFQRLLSDFDAGSLHETIPNFHHTEKRYSDFVRVVERDPLNRAHMVRDEIDFIVKREADCSVITSRLKAGEIPLRVTHNDTKLNNVLIDTVTGEGICLIDLDTVMPGSYLYDFGDAIRFGCNTAAEDETDLDKVKVDLELYECYTRGYLESVKDLLTSEELEYLPFSAKLMTFECGMRFLTDYLNGDTYFKIHRPNHNLDRARNQLKLVREMEENMDIMKRITEKY